jgi:hypothetical protein
MKGKFEEVLFDDKDIIVCAKESYSIENFKMMSVRMLDDVLICDDR